MAGARAPRTPLLGTLLVLSFLALGAVACSGDGADGSTGADKEQVRATLREALTAHADGDLDKAEELYRETLRLDPQNKFAYYNLGVIAQTQGDSERAISSYRDAIDIDPDFVPALFNLAILATETGDAHDAVGLYSHIVEVAPDDANAHLNLGFLLIDQGRAERGQRELDEAVRLDPSLAERITPQTGATGPVATGASS